MVKLSDIDAFVLKRDSETIITTGGISLDGLAFPSRDDCGGGMEARYRRREFLKANRAEEVLANVLGNSSIKMILRVAESEETCDARLLVDSSSNSRLPKTLLWLRNSSN
jgi:hypothetical protein